MAKRTRKTNFVASKRHALFFFLIYIVGGLILTFEKQFVGDLFPNSRFPEALIIGTAFILMGTYVFFVTLVPATKLRTDIAADNVYYLGFLYTLTSLAVAISIDDPAETILANFGVAIVSTLIGIAARVGLNQLRVDPNEIEEATRLELSEATRRVRAEMDETILQIANFRNLSMQVMSEGYEEVKENIDKASKDLMKSIEDVVEQSTEPLTELAKQTQAASEQAIEAISEVTKSNQKLAKSSTAMIDGMQKANEALSAMTEHYSDTGVLDEQILEKVEEQMFAIKDEIKTIDGIKKANEALNALAEHYSDTSVLDKKILEKVDSQMFAIKDEIKKLASSQQVTNKEKKSLQKKTPKSPENKDLEKNISRKPDAKEEKSSITKKVIKAVEDMWTSSSVLYKGKIIRISKGSNFVDGAPFPTLQAAKQYIDAHNDS